MAINIQSRVTGAFKTADSLVTGIRKPVTLTGYTGNAPAPADYTAGARNDLTSFTIPITGLWTDYDKAQLDRDILAGDAQLIVDAAAVLDGATAVPRSAVQAVTRGDAEWAVVGSSGEYSYTYHLRRIGVGVAGG